MNLSNFFKKRIEGNDYPDLRKDLRRIRVARSTHDYVARAILYSVFLGIIVSLVLFTVFFLFFGLYLPYSIGLSAGTGAGLGFVVYHVFLSFPGMKATNREKEIEDMLPHAVAYMLALAKGGFEPIEIFDSLGEQEEYGEIAREAAAISRNAGVLGYNPTEAIEDVAETTPSQEFEDFLTSLSSVIETGSSIPDFLHRRSQRYYREAEEKQEENLEFLGVMAEVYVVALGLGPIFAIIILILFGMMGNFMTNVLYLIVYLLIPLGTGIFIVLLDIQSRTRFGESGRGESESSGESFLGSIDRRINHTKDRLKNVRALLDHPMNVLWISVPAGIAVSAGLFFGLEVQIETLATSFILVSLTPLAVLFELKRRKEERMIEITPDFLNSFSDALSSGLSPSKAFFSLSPERYGELESEIERIEKDIEWGSSVSEAFHRSAVRLKEGIVSRVMSLVKRSSEAASEISGILNVLADDVSTERSLQQERRRITITYVIIVFLSFGIFLLTAYSISTSLMPLMVRMTEARAGTPGQSPVAQIGGIDLAVIKHVFFRASLIQGLSSGLLAGMMQTGRLSSGLKYSVIMIGIAWSFFTVLGF